MTEKIYRNLSWKHKKLVFSLLFFVVLIVVIFINILSNPGANVQELYYVAGAMLLFVVALGWIGYTSRIGIDKTGVKYFGVFGKTKFIPWENIKKIGVFTFNNSTYKTKEVPLSDAYKPYYWGTKIVYVSSEIVSETDLRYIQSKNAISFTFRKDLFGHIILEYNEYLKRRDNS